MLLNNTSVHRYNEFDYLFILTDVLNCQDVSRICLSNVLCTNYGSGIISTRDYPIPYPQMMRCSWLLRADDNSYIRFFIQEFDVGRSNRDCLLDNVEVYSGHTINDRFRRRYCNRNPPPETILSDFNEMFVIFTSDHVDDNSMGFLARYEYIYYNLENVWTSPGNILS